MSRVLLCFKQAISVTHQRQEWLSAGSTVYYLLVCHEGLAIKSHLFFFPYFPGREVLGVYQNKERLTIHKVSQAFSGA
ncbi:hypothetical protein I7I50_04723 [Histoplasma capsulatum G186AR]|uniref:Uncharacterized protein n=1 Tax=Ajellomyces capsulatus TaxID=5037 RepID=A0A8H7YKK8_AJECA|nr:hypothetical protein I7I52_05632 [Histoplasma capsulatum]QSS75553.1 hypothetical protein I7I50_04723 [Histoplasma capsulatum G186AR]